MRTYQLDPASAEVLANNARQIEMVLFLFSIIKGIGNAIQKVGNGIATWVQANNTSRELNAMPDYILDDIGISRHQIDAVATGKLVRELSKPALAEVQPVKAVADENNVDTPIAA
jgi:uncharacterized protein YjiS (DUF1127 family)